MDALANVLAGLGLFFVGVRLLTENLQNLAGRSFRQAVAKWTKKPVAGFSIGSFLGAVAQSMAVTIFILVSLLTAGLITVRSAMPVLVGANFGTSILVFLTTLNIKVIMLALIGTSGMLMVSDRFERIKAHVGALFGIGLLFLGISMLQGGALTLVEQPWASQLLESFKDSYLITFLLGCMITVVAQSAAATSILVITLAGVGIFGFEQTVMGIFGANFGSGIVSLVLSGKFQGKSRQLAMFQIVFINFISTLVFVALFYVEVLGHVPLLKTLVQSISDNIEQQMAWVYLLLNVVGLVFLPFSRHIELLLDRCFPSTQSESDSTPKFIHDQAINDPIVALDLVKLEQNNLASFFTRYFALIRGSTISNQRELKQLHDSFSSVSGLVTELMEDMGALRSTDGIHESLNQYMNNNLLIQMLEATLYDLSLALDSVDSRSPLFELREMATEALDTVVLTLNDVLSNDDEFDKNMLSSMVGDKGQVMQGIRRFFLESQENIEGSEQLMLLKITNLCERFFWILSDLKIDSADLKEINTTKQISSELVL